MPYAVCQQEFLEVVRPALERGDATRLADEVRRRWTPRELCRLLQVPAADVRRVAAVVVGLIGDASCAGCLARALHDEDEQVNQMAEHGLWSIWFRSGKPAACDAFSRGVSLLGEEQYEEAIKSFCEAVRADPGFAEAHHQLAIAHFLCAQWDASAQACRRAVDLMPAHFGALCAMGHAYTQLDRLEDALTCYRRALAINPRMPAISQAVRRLERKRSSRPAKLAAPGGGSAA